MPEDKKEALATIADAAAEAKTVVDDAAYNAKKVLALEAEIALEKRLKCERELSNSTYAPIIIKTIVFSLVGLICTAFVIWLLAKVWP